MRARIDVSEIEATTKIRAKYLRALENEEWGLLPGPTFVKSFLRTTPKRSGLDGKSLVEEFRLTTSVRATRCSSRSSPRPSVSAARRAERPLARLRSGRQRHRPVIVLLVVLLLSGGSGGRLATTATSTVATTPSTPPARAGTATTGRRVRSALAPR